MKIIRIIYWGLVFCGYALFCQQTNAFDMRDIESSANKNINNNLVFVTGLVKPPFIIDEAGKGMQLALVEKALSYSDLDVSFQPMPLGRNLMGYKSLNADGILTLLPDYEHPSLYISRPYITYQNVAISLTEKQFSIETVSDLLNKHIVAFQNARKFLGSEYSDVVSYSVDYRELSNQGQQIDMLFLRRTEVIIMDINIFK